MSIFATYFDQAMSSSEDEREALELEKVRRRKVILLGQLNAFLKDPRVLTIVKEEPMGCEFIALTTNTLLTIFI